MKPEIFVSQMCLKFHPAVPIPRMGWYYFWSQLTSSYVRKLFMKQTTAPRVAPALLLLCLALSVQAGSIIYNFDVGRDYKANGVIGSLWDGVYFGNGDVPNGNNGGSIGGTIHADETTFGGYLSIQSTNTGWAGTEDDGFLLYKLVAGDFDASVQIGGNYDNRAFNQSGLLVRAFTTNGPAWGAPF